MSKERFFKGTFLLTSAGLISRIMGFFYRIVLSHTIGAEGIGLYQLVVPLQHLVLAMTTFGIQTALSRLISSHTALGEKKEAQDCFRIGTFLALFLSGMAAWSIFTFSDFSTVLFSQSDHKRVNDLKVGYIPEGFSLNYESNNKFERSKEYVKGNDFFTVLKQSNGNRIDINTEYKIYKVTQIDGIDYVEFGEEEHGQGIVWEKDGYQYVMTGNITIDELFKIAISIVYN